MAKIHIVLLGIIKVLICTAEDIETTTNEADLRVWNIKDLTEPDGSLILNDIQFSDGSQVKIPSLKNGETDTGCYEYNRMCLSEKNGTNTGPVCSYLKKYGLVEFPVDCDIHLKNCIIKAREEKLGNRYTADTFFYNEQGKSCSYYLEQAETVRNAAKLYLLYGNLRRRLTKGIYERLNLE